MEGSCSGYPSSFSQEPDGSTIICIYKPGDGATNISYQFKVPSNQSSSDYSIIKENKTIPDCASYWRPSSPLTGNVLEIYASSPNFSPCTGKVEYTILHISGETISFTVGASHTFDP